MRNNKTDRLAETARRTSLANGSLIDVSDAARSCGIQLPVALSRSLWTSLVQPFPSARSGDFVSLEKMLGSVQTLIKQEWLAKKQFRYFLPEERPRWIGHSFFVRVQFNYAYGKFAAVVLSSVDEIFIYKPPASPAVLPSALMVRLFRVLLQLPLSGRGADTVLVERMRETANLLMQACPLKGDVYEYFRRWRPQRPTAFSHGEFRAVLSRTLGEVLVCIGACESEANAPLVKQLVKFHLAMASPLSDLAEITESLLRLAARLPYREGPMVFNPFPPLLESCFEMRYSLDKGSTTIPAKALQTLREQFSQMDELVVGADRHEYLQLRQWFEKIDDGSPLGNYVNLGRWNDPEPVWQ